MDSLKESSPGERVLKDLNAKDWNALYAYVSAFGRPSPDREDKAKDALSRKRTG